MLNHLNVIANTLSSFLALKINIVLSEKMSNNNNNRAELVFVASSGKGHLLSTVQLAKLILQRNQRISVTIHIINFPNHLDLTNAYVEAQLRDTPYPTRLAFVTFPPLSKPPDPSSPFSRAEIIELQKPLLKQAVEDRLRTGLPKPAGFVLDMFCAEMADIATELHVPSYCFFTTGASFLSLICYALSLADDHGVDPAAEFSDPNFSGVLPGFKNPVTSSVMPVPFQDKENGSKFILNFARKFREMKGILVNTYEELESSVIQALGNSEGDKIPPIYPVGPILELDDKNRGGSDKEERVSVIRWLDGQPESSVVFLCFGSMGSFEEEQVKEIANGLEKSGHGFLWALRKPPPEGKTGPGETFLEALPEGFLERTGERGKVIGWAPQVDVLAHPAVGGFVSHCGWNSTLESTWFGVPMATWPLYAEQQFNAFMLVKEKELAVEIRMDYKLDWKSEKGNFIVTAQEIENGIKKVMNMEEEMKKKVKRTSEEAKYAVQEGGSSYIWLGRFIQDSLTNVS